MGTAFTLLHAASAAVLIAAHGAFLLRGLAVEAGRITPGRLDYLARTLSQLLLPVTALSGLILRSVGGVSGDGASGGGPPVGIPGGSSPALLHLLLGLAPLAAIPLVFFARVLLKRRRQAPWLLPAVNLVLLGTAAATGIYMWR
jgi:hypothetical protein